MLLFTPSAVFRRRPGCVLPGGAETGIRVFLYVLIRIPGETASQFRKTVACVRQCNPAGVHLSIFYPYRGADLYRKAKEMRTFRGFVAAQGTESKAAVLDLPGFSKEHIRREYVLFPYRVHRGKKPIHAILPLTARNYLGGCPRLYSLYGKAMSSI